MIYLSSFPEKISSFPFYCFLLFLCIVLLRRASYLSLLCSGFTWVYISLSLLPFTSLHFSAICKPPETTTLPSCISFSLGWFWSLPPLQCYEPPFIVLQAFSLPDLILWIYSSPPLYNHKEFKLGHTWMACASLIVQLVKNLPAVQEILVWFLGQEGTLQKVSATDSSILGLPLWLNW